MSKRKFKVGDRVKYITSIDRYNNQVATIVHLDNDKEGSIRFDDHTLGWPVTTEDHENGCFEYLEIGGGYYGVFVENLELVSSTKRKKVKSTKEYGFDKAAIIEQAECDLTTRLVNNFVNECKERKV